MIADIFFLAVLLFAPMMFGAWRMGWIGTKYYKPQPTRETKVALKAVYLRPNRLNPEGKQWLKWFTHSAAHQHEGGDDS